MSNCPKCEKKVPIYHLGQNCPHCGVNLRFVNFEEDFYRDAKKAELSGAKINIFIAKLKASLIGSKLAIARLVLVLLPVLTLLIPFANIKVNMPFVDDGFALSALGIFTAYSSGYVNLILGMLSSETNGAAFSALIVALIPYAVMVLMVLLNLILTVISFTSIKKMPKVLCVISILGALSSVITAILSKRFASIAASAGGILSANLSFGSIFAVIAFGIVFFVNFLIIKKGLNIQYKEGDLERIEIGKKIKSGELNLEDLPQPIVETAETREIQEAIEAQQAAYRKKEAAEI
ncbi:MAG TPA: hypothetical protein GXZ23_03785 [Clostridiales bacterium]|nr:hypothetical protein [Clostridiales bacterium]